MVPDEILNKPGKLTDAEFYIMKTHANHTIDIFEKTKGISKLSFEVAAYHHEKLDGTGYPLQLKADKINKYWSLWTSMIPLLASGMRLYPIRQTSRKTM